MEATKTTQQQLFGDFVEAFRAYKKHKREWQARMEIKLAEEEEYIRNKREVLYAEEATHSCKPSLRCLTI